MDAAPTPSVGAGLFDRADIALLACPKPTKIVTRMGRIKLLGNMSVPDGAAVSPALPQDGEAGSGERTWRTLTSVKEGVTDAEIVVQLKDKVVEAQKEVRKNGVRSERREESVAFSS